MAFIKTVTPSNVFMARLKHGADLIDEITSLCKKNNIRLGRVNAIGAVQKARLGFYDQQTKTYDFFEMDRPLEITNLTGNISLKDGEPMAHVHVTLADHDGKAYGGHLAQGTVIFACECVIEAFDGPEFNRTLDEETALPLWAEPK
jgi:uncharacterized protein